MAQVNYRLLKQTEYYLWDRFLTKVGNASIYQTRDYYEALKILNWDYEIFVKINEDNLDISTGALIQKKRVPLINRFVSVVNYGPISVDDKEVQPFLNELIKHLKNHKHLFTDINLLNQYDIDYPRLLNLGNNHTFILDLTQTLDTLFTNFSKTFRNCIRKAEKEGVMVRFSTEERDIERFIEYYEAMINRKQIESINTIFLRQVIKNLLENNRGFIAYTTYNGTVYNMAVIGCINKTARYLYGASISHPTGLPPMGQYLHYEIIKELQNEGFSTYDLGGVVGKEVKENDPSYGVYKFKKGFGGEFVTLTKNYRVIFSKLVEYLNMSLIRPKS